MAVPFGIQIPNPALFTPRDYQLPFWRSITFKEGGFKRCLLVWHRRAGKDWALLNKIAELLLVEMWDTPTTCVYLAGNSKKHGASITWDNKTNDGLSYLDAFPPELIKRKDDRDFTIEFKNGSVFKVMTTLDKNSARGLNPKIVVFSEYDFIDNGPYIWTSVILPIIQMNGGMAIFATTPDGAKQTYQLYTKNYENPRWFVEIRDCEHTLHNGQRILTDAMIEELREDGMTDQKVQQEFYCDFFSESEGTFYEKQFREIRQQGRAAGRIPYDPALPVHTFWDLGIDDPMAVWFAQVDYTRNWRWIDYFQTSDQSLTECVGIINKKPYLYGHHIAPHDIKSRDLVTGQSRLERMLQLGFRFSCAPKLAFKDGIDAARVLLTRSHFDSANCGDGLEALKHYKKKESPTPDPLGNTQYTGEPVHDWCSHGSDAFRMAAIVRDFIENNNTINYAKVSLKDFPTHANTDYDMLGF